MIKCEVTKVVLSGAPEEALNETWVLDVYSDGEKFEKLYFLGKETLSKYLINQLIDKGEVKRLKDDEEEMKLVRGDDL